MCPLDSPSKVICSMYNLMNLFLLVIEIHVFKVLLSHMTMGYYTDLYLNQMSESQKVRHGSIGWSIKSDLFNVQTS